MPHNKKIIGEIDERGQVKVDAEYITRLRSECRERRLHEAELVAEVARLTYLVAGLATAQEPEVAQP